MKKLLLFIFLIVSSLTFSEKRKIKNISEIKTLELMVSEKSFINGREENKVYSLKYVVPDKMKKEMISPSSHKGEIFIYKNGVKKTYLPIFDEVLEDKKAPEENFVIDTISLLQRRDKTDKSFRRLYNSGRNLQIKDRDIVIMLEDMNVVSDYYIPNKIRVFENNSLIGELNISNIEINKTINEEEFEI